MRHTRWRQLRYAFGAVVLLAAIYVGSYYAMVERWEIEPAGVVAEAFVAEAFAVDGAVFPEYRLRQDWLYNFYAPIHAVDRKLRPDFWARSK